MTWFSKQVVTLQYN